MRIFLEHEDGRLYAGRGEWTLDPIEALVFFTIVDATDRALIDCLNCLENAQLRLDFGGKSERPSPLVSVVHVALVCAEASLRSNLPRSSVPLESSWWKYVSSLRRPRPGTNQDE
jgi:hypothetical protein